MIAESSNDTASGAATRVVVRAAGALALLLGLTVLFLPQLDIDALKTVLPTLNQMKANTALALVLLGAALILRGWRSNEAPWRAASVSLIVLVALLAVATLFEYATGLGLGIDRLLYADRAPGRLHPGRMAVNTAICFLLLSSAIALSDAQKRALALCSQVLALSAALIALTTVFGNLLSVEAVGGLTFYTLMALPTAIGLLVVAVGTLFLRPDAGIMRVVINQQASGRVVRVLLATVLVTTPMLAFLQLEGQRAGLYGNAFGLAVFALSQLVTLTFVVWWAGNLLYRTDAGRQEAEAGRRELLAQLETANLRLQQTVVERTEAHAASESRLRLVLENTPALISYLDTALRFRFCNRTYHEWFGADPATLIGRTVKELLGAAAYAEVQRYYERALAGERLTYERRVQHREIPRDVMVELVPDAQPDGSVAGIFVSANDITARRRDEQALRESEERFQLVVRGSEDGIWDWNIVTGHCYYSPRFAQLLGYAEHEIEPVRSFFESCLHPDDRERTLARMRAHFGGHVSYEVEYRLRTRAGEYRWFHARGQASWDRNGKPVRFTGALRDITDRQEANERLSRTTDLLAQTERLAMIGGWELSVPEMTPTWSAQAYRIHELDPADKLDLATAIAFYPPEARPAAEDAIRACVEGGEPWDLELPFNTAKGRRIWVRTLGSAEWRDGRIARLYGTLQDITERKQAELAHEHSRQFLDAVIEGIPQPVFVKDSQHRWVLFNSAYCDMMERPRAELLDKSDPDLYPPELVQRFWAEDNEAFSMNQPLFFETSLKRSDGSVRWLLKSKRRVDLPDGAHVVGVATDITRQKLIELALRESEERFRGLTQLSADWFWEQDEQFRFTTQTGGGLDSMNITPEDMLGKTRWELPFVGMTDESWAAHKAMLEAHESFHNLELTRRNDVGELRYVSLSGEPVFDVAGRFCGYRGVGRDITASKSVEEALRRREESHRLLAENSSDMITMLTPEAIIEYASPASAIVIGLSPEEINGRSVSEFIHPEDLVEARAAFVEVVKCDRARVVTCRLRHRDKGWLWVETSFRAVRDANSLWTRQVIGVSRDADERVRVTEALNRFQYVLDHTGDMIYIADTQTLRFSYVNLGACEALGHTREELLGKTPWDLRTTGSEAEVRMSLQPLLRDQVASVQFETTHRRANGTEFPVDARVQLVHRPGEGDLLVWIVRDATDRRKIDRMKSEFVATVSHELRTPLTSIRGSLGLIIGGAVGALPEQAGSLVRIAYTNSERLVRLINDILDIEKIDSGKMRFDLQPHRIGPLLEQAVEANRGYGEQLGVRFEIQGEIPDAVVALDADRFMQVMSNLLSNAAKFSPSPGIVEVAAARSNGRLRIRVTDHGPGIPVEFRSKIFGRFCQADSSDSRQKGGTGLGLSIVKAIVESHGGQVGFDSEIGVGTTFHVGFPESGVTDAADHAGKLLDDSHVAQDKSAQRVSEPRPERHAARSSPQVIASASARDTRPRS